MSQTARHRWLLAEPGTDREGLARHLEDLERLDDLEDPQDVEECRVPARVRVTRRLPPPFDDLGVKLFRAPSWWRRLLGPVLPRPALREWRTTRMLREEKVPVVEPVALAVGKETGAGDACFFRWRADAVDLARAVETGALDAIHRREIARGLGALVAKLHAAGFVHRDLHAGNVLVAQDGSLLLLDFHRARRRRALRRCCERQDLFDLSHFLCSRASGRETLRFLRAYFGPRWPRSRASRRILLRRLEEGARRSLRRFLRHFERRALAPRRHVPLKARGWSGLGKGEESVEVLRQLGVDPEETVTRQGTIVHRGRGSRVVRFSHGSLEYAAKSFEDAGLVGALKRLGRGSRARRAWLGLFRLRMLRIETPEPILFLEEPWWKPRRRSLLITRYASFLHLHEFLAGADPSTAEPVETRLALDLARLHSGGYRNRDLKAENFLVDGEGRHLYWLDPDGLRPRNPVDARAAARDLMRLNASFPGLEPLSLKRRLRFVRSYVAARAERIGDRSRLVRDTCRLTREKWQRNERTLRSASSGRGR